MKKNVLEELTGDIEFIGTGGVARKRDSSDLDNLDSDSSELLSIFYTLLGYAYYGMKSKFQEYKGQDSRGFAETEAKHQTYSNEIKSVFPGLDVYGDTSLPSVVDKVLTVVELQNPDTSSKNIDIDSLTDSITNLKNNLSTGMRQGGTNTAPGDRAAHGRLMKFIIGKIKDFKKDPMIETKLLKNFLEYREAKEKNKPAGVVKLAKDLLQKLPGYLIYTSFYDFAPDPSVNLNGTESLKLFVKNYINLIPPPNNDENSFFQTLEQQSDTLFQPKLQTIQQLVKEAIDKRKEFSINFDPFFADPSKILDSTGQTFSPKYPMSFINATKNFQKEIKLISDKIFTNFDELLELNSPLQQFKYKKKTIQLDQSDPYFKVIIDKTNSEATYFGLVGITKTLSNIPPSTERPVVAKDSFMSRIRNLFESNRSVAENKIVIDLEKLKQNKLNESYITMYGNWIKFILSSLLGDFNIPVSVKGSEKDVMAFAGALGSEAKYLKAAQKYGLTDKRTYSLKSSLDSAVQKFQKETGLVWPFK